ncbi:MAG: hypothetical protein JXQ76_09230 [Campylobacterales bacterium]|nr:hypothetical protein [Campylobacterales bacterium]
MKFGSIEYLNLLPFRVFLKKYLQGNATYQALHYKSGVPSKINRDFKSRRIDAAFISSIESRHVNCSDMGIIAHKEVRSVFVIPYNVSKSDSASATSNKLAQILKLQGEVIIGDRALKFYLEGGEAIDLASVWYQKYKLPFVFARLCSNRHTKTMQKLIAAFKLSPIKIPQYILKKEAAKRGIAPKQLQEYLSYIHYTMDYKAKRSFKLFLAKARALD